MSDVFISYSSIDKNVADTICAKLEQSEFKCWIAPRDIRPGEEYASGIVRGIDNCKCMIIIFSQASNDSKHVLREVERAVGRDVVIIPLRISNIMPSDSMDYFLKVAHWLDAKDMKLEQAIAKLIPTISAILEQPVKIQPDTTTVEEGVEPRVSSKRNFILIAAFLIMGVGASVFYFMFGSPSDSEPKHDTKLSETVDAVLDKLPSKYAMLNELIQQNQVLLNDASKLNLESVLEISEKIPNREMTLKTWIEPNRSQFMEDDSVKFKVSVDQDAYLSVYVHSMDDSSYLIYPNPEAPSKLLKQDTVFTVGNGDTFELVIAEPFGVDVVQFIATTDKEEFKKLLSKYVPLEGMNIAIVDRKAMTMAMQGIKKRGINVKKSAGNKAAQAGKSWGEALILLNTIEKQ